MQPIHNLDPKAKWGAAACFALHTHTPVLNCWLGEQVWERNFPSDHALQLSGLCPLQWLPCQKVSIHSKHFHSATDLAVKVPFLNPDKQHMNLLLPTSYTFSKLLGMIYHITHTHTRGGWGSGIRKMVHTWSSLITHKAANTESKLQGEEKV